MDNRMVDGLVKISKPKIFYRGQYICREGEAGDEMYIVLSGSVGVFINSVMDDHTLISTVKAGGFFGEMAIVDQKPRSAAGVALEDTQCIAIDQKHLKHLIVNCPDVTLLLLGNLSSHIRELDQRLFKKEIDAKEVVIKEFSPPLKAHNMAAPPMDGRYLTPIRVTCPVCEKKIVVQSINFALLEPVGTDGIRSAYKGFDARWHYIWNCAECGYTNFYSHFFIEYAVPHGDMLRCLAKQNQFYTFHYRPGSVFDRLVFDYYRAIHLNECLEPEGKVMLAKLWLSLHWLYSDASDPDLAAVCRKNALDYYEAAYTAQTELHTAEEKQKCAIIIAELYMASGDRDSAHAYFTKAAEYPGTELCGKARESLEQFWNEAPRSGRARGG